jgi:hypothetical protein
MMTTDTARPITPTKSRRRWTRAAGWTLIGLGVIVSWVWSVELTIVGASVYAAVTGAGTLLLFSAGIALVWRVSPHRGRGPSIAFRVAVIATALGAIVAGIVPVAVISMTTGTATSDVTSGTIAPDYSVAGVAVVSSDEYHQTTLDLTVRARDRTTPQLVATVSFTDGSADITCTNTRQTWTHHVSTVAMICDTFTPIALLQTISGIAVAPR